ncbi:MAG: hypothetical protein R3E86_04960 [Pseudomonadales bacterium]
MKLLRVLLGVVVGLVAVIAAVLMGARFADGPLGLIAGGPFRSGTLVSGPEPDWRFARDLNTVAFQLLDPARSRTTWIMEYDGRIYIPCGYMDTAWGRLWKHWPIEAERDGRAILRIDGKLYERRLQRLRSGPALEPVLAELNRKYAAGATPATVARDSLWLFEMAPRQP